MMRTLWSYVVLFGFIYVVMLYGGEMLGYWDIVVIKR
jgi:hypothetical protein